MTDREMKQRIRTAMEHAAPDQWERILSSCDQTPQAAEAPKKGALTSMTDIRNDKNRKYTHKKRSPLAAISAVAAAFALMIGGFAMTGQNTSSPIDSIILLDVNPSLSLSVDAQEVVHTVEAHNQEALDVLGTMDLAGTSLEVSINALIGSMMQKGYLDDAHNSILVSVENKDTKRGSQLQEKISSAIASAMHTDTMDASVLSQQVNPDDTSLAQLAQTHHISLGKAAYIQEMITSDPTLTFEKLAPMSINDIALIASSKNLDSQVVTQTGTASDKAYISKNAALEKALEHASVSSTDAKHVHVEFDSDDGRMVYEIEFETTELEYDYDIDARSGEVVEYETEKRHDYKPGSSHAQEQANQPSHSSNPQKPTGEPSDPDVPPSHPSTSSQSQLIGEEAAKTAALTHAGVNASDVTYIHCNLDYDDGIPENYDVEFVVDVTEYDYEISPYNGNVLSYDRERVDRDDRNDRTHETTGNTDSTEPAQQDPTYIGKEAAFLTALSHAGVSESDVRKKEVNLDNDDGKMVYEIEWKSGKIEYDYEVDAITGQILKAEKDMDD